MKMIEEIENKKQDEDIDKKEKVNSLKDYEDLKNGESFNSIDNKKAIEGLEAIQKMREEFVESNGQILKKENKEELDKNLLYKVDNKNLDNYEKDKKENKVEESKTISKNKDENNIEEDIKKEKKKDKKEPKKQSKLLKIIGNILYYIAFILILAVLLIVVIQRFSDNEMALAGFRIFNILTGSMEPEYNVGDILISKTIEPEDINIGDDIVYKGKEKPFQDLIVTHRVVDLNKEEDGTYNFITHGIANDVDDPMISESQIYGKIIYKVRSFSMLSKAVNNMYIFFFIIFIPIVVLTAIKVIQLKHEKIEDYED